jgi:DNA adenine methylase
MSDELLAMFNALNSHDEVRERIIRAPFPYPGAKSRSQEHILPHLPYREFYGEPFGGSGAILLARNESPLEVFNDRFSGVTCFYRVVRDRTRMNALIDRLTFCLHSREEFVWCRSTWKNCEDEVERAARWYYMVMCSFAAQGRHFGRSIKGKPQMGPKLKSNLKLFPEVSKRLQNAQIENQDWRQILSDFDQPGAVWYLDPPYYQYAKGMYECEMTKEDHRELLDRIFQLRGFVALSGYENELYDKYEWDNRYSWTVRVSSLGQGFTETNNLAGHEGLLQRGTAKETLWIKEAA